MAERALQAANSQADVINPISQKHSELGWLSLIEALVDKIRARGIINQASLQVFQPGTR